MINEKTNYLDEALLAFNKKYGEGRRISQHGDGVGKYAFLIERKEKLYYFCAKNSKFGETVSCHVSLIEAALPSRTPILMWLQGKCWMFKPEVLLENRPWANIHNGAIMINFRLQDVNAIDIDELIKRQSEKRKPAVPTESQEHILAQTPSGRALLQIGAEPANRNGAI